MKDWRLQSAHSADLRFRDFQCLNLCPYNEAIFRGHIIAYFRVFRGRFCLHGKKSVNSNRRARKLKYNLGLDSYRLQVKTTASLDTTGHELYLYSELSGF